MDVSGGLTLVETLLKTLGSQIWTKVESILGLESELEKLKDTITTIQAVLLDADEEDIHQHQHRSHVVRNRLQRLREALYRADDLFDEIATLAHRKKLMSSNKVSRELRVFFSCFNQLRSAYDWSEELERIREMLDDIVKDHRFEFVQRHPVALEPWRMMKIKHDPRETHSFCEESDIIGREKDKKEVIDMLLGSTSVDKNVTVISIVGIGGLGKTSLAQLVYNDAMIKSEFPLRMWVCVSDDFNISALLQQIIAAAKNQTTSTADEDDGKQRQLAAMKINQVDLPNMTMDELQSSLGKVLNGKKYLLVLDDIWNEDPLKWHELSVLLEKGGSGSRIIVTTRSERVANIVGSRKIHKLEGLSEEHSKNLFERIAFKDENNKKEDDLVKIGEEILCKCRNVPLAIRVVGSLLRGQDTRTWEYIKNTDLVNIKQDDNGILPVLKISYYHLPFHLKSCFSYCSVFPKDHRFTKDDLIRLWMAQGFVMPLVGQSLEDTGDEYFNHLLQRCFFQDVEKDSSGEIISCKMHDLIHDVAKEVVGTEILSSFNNSNNDFNERTRHIFIDHNTIEGSDDIVSSFQKMKRMRSLLSNDPPYTWDSPFLSRIKLFLSEVQYLRQLRVLDLHRMELVEVPSVIGELMHLRYLDLSYNDELTMLPGSITKLYNLQTLKLRHCYRLKTLPRDLSKLVNLRNLDIFGCTKLRYMPPGMNKMTSLHKLTGFVMSGTRKTSQWRSHCVGELGDLVNFTNHADILHLMVHEDARYGSNILRNIMHKQHLRQIQIMWRAGNDKSEGNTNPEVLLEGLESCQNLSQIFLEGTYECSVPYWLEHLPRLNHLRHLKVLKLVRLKNLKFVESSDISKDGAPTASRTTEDLVFFPSLEELVLEELPKLKGWWETTDKSDSGENGDKQEAHNQLTTAGMHFNSYSFPRLTFLSIWECPELKTIPWCPNLEILNLIKFNIALKPMINWSSDARLFSSCNDVEQGGLRELGIDDAGYLNYVPLESFHRLSHLTITSNKKTETLPRGMVFTSGCLCCLRFLTIRNCMKLKRLSWEGFWEHCTALETLELDWLYMLELEDEDEEEEVKSSNRDGDEGEIRKEVTPWRFLSHSLCNLRLFYLPKLEKLPNGMRHLTSLQSLEIRGCKNLKSMSEEMRHLTSLQQLTLFNNSTEFNERCKRPSGADWPNIQHIPKIEIEVYDYTAVQFSTITYEN